MRIKARNFMVGFLIGLSICFALQLLCSFANASQFDDFDVEWPPSNEAGIHLLQITVDGCVTKFKIPNKEFAAFSTDPEATAQALKKAIERAEDGCR